MAEYYIPLTPDDLVTACDALIGLFGAFIERGGNPRDVLNSPVLLFEIDDRAAVGSEREPVYQPSDAYRELCTTLQRRMGDRE